MWVPGRTLALARLPARPGRALKQVTAALERTQMALGRESLRVTSSRDRMELGHVRTQVTPGRAQTLATLALGRMRRR